MSSNLSQSQRERAQIEEQLKDQVRANNQQARLIWLLTNLHPEGRVVVDESTVHPLWELDFERVGGEKSTQLAVSAKRMPEPTELQIDLLAKQLIGSSSHPGDAMTAVGLGDYPFSFLARLLASKVKFTDGKWIAVEPAQT
jgi:hypothetical protein